MPTQANLFPWVDQRFLDASGNPASGYKVYTYIAGSSTPAPTWPDKNLAGSPNSNPIITDSTGRFDMWGSPDYRYKIVLKTDADVTVKTWDYVELALVEGDDLQRVETTDTSSVTLVGEGTVANPLQATVNISSLSLNALSITTTGLTAGLYALDLSANVAALETAVDTLQTEMPDKLDKVGTSPQTVAGAVTWSALQTLSAGLDISAGLLTVQGLATAGAAEYLTVDSVGTVGSTALDLSGYLSKTDTGSQTVAGPVAWSGLQTMDAGLTAQYKSGATTLSKVEATGSSYGSVAIGAYNASGVLRGSLTLDGGSAGLVYLESLDATSTEKSSLQLNHGGVGGYPQATLSTSGTTSLSNRIVLSDYEPNIAISSYNGGVLASQWIVDGHNGQAELTTGGLKLTPLATGGAAEYLTVDTNGDVSSTALDLSDYLSKTATGTQTTASNLDFSAGWLKVGLGAAPATGLLGQNASGHIVSGDALATLQFVTDQGATTSNAVSITNATASTSTTTGAHVVTGGAGIGGALYVGGNGVFSGRVYANGGVTGSTSELQVNGSARVSSTLLADYAIKTVNTDANLLQALVSYYGTVPESTGDRYLSVKATATGSQITAGVLGTSGGVTNSLVIQAAENSNEETVFTFAVAGNTSNKKLSVTDTTASTSTSTGALTVTGGAGIGGALYFGGGLMANNTSLTPSANSQWTMHATSDTNFRITYRGSDGTTRTADIPLA